VRLSCGAQEASRRAGRDSVLQQTDLLLRREVSQCLRDSAARGNARAAAAAAAAAKEAVLTRVRQLLSEHRLSVSEHDDGSAVSVHQCDDARAVPLHDFIAAEFRAALHTTATVCPPP
jgi:hypothetical protein